MVVLPLAESFLVLMILAAYSWPVQSLTQRRTTEKAPLGRGTGSAPPACLSAPSPPKPGLGGLPPVTQHPVAGGCASRDSAPGG